MNRAEEAVFAWSLVDASKPVLPPDMRMWLCVKLGAGDQAEAIDEILRIRAHLKVGLPKELWAPSWAWVSGYLGSDHEERLRNLLARLRVPEPSRSPARQPSPRNEPLERRPRRIQHSFTRVPIPSRTACLDPAMQISPLRDKDFQFPLSAAAMTGPLAERTPSVASTAT